MSEREREREREGEKERERDRQTERDRERDKWLKRSFYGIKSLDFDILEPLIIMSYVKVWLKDIYWLTCIRNKSF